MHYRRSRWIAIAVLSLLPFLALAALSYVASTDASQQGGMDAMSIDMDVTGNTATSLGPLDQCVVVSPGSSVTLDVTATNIPASNPMIAFAFTLNYPAGVLTVQSADPNFLIASSPGSNVLNASDPTPDSDGT